MAAGDVIVTAHNIGVIYEDIWGGAWFSTALSLSLNTIRWIIYWWNGRKERKELLSATMTPLYLRVPVSHNIKIKSKLKLRQPVGVRPIFFIYFYYLWHFNISPVKARPSPWWDHEGMWQLHALLNNLCENRSSFFFFAYKTMTAWKDRK